MVFSFILLMENTGNSIRNLYGSARTIRPESPYWQDSAADASECVLSGGERFEGEDSEAASFNETVRPERCWTALAKTKWEANSPQTRHKLKNLTAENGGFLRVAAGRIGSKKWPRIADSVNEISAKYLILLWSRATGLEPATYSLGS